MNRWRRNLPLALLLLLGSLGWQGQAHANAIDDFIWLLEQVESVGGDAVKLPVTSQQVKEAKGYINCMADAGDDDVAQVACFTKLEGTQLASSIGVGNIPGWFYDLLHMYIAFRTHDYWGVIKYVGTAGVCIVAQMMAGGALDVCGLIKELVEIAKGLLNAGAAIGKFIVDLGEGAWNGVKAIGCSLGLGGCSSGKSTPAHEIVYTYIFAPMVKPKGLEAIEHNDASQFGKLRAMLSLYAQHSPVIWTDPVAQKSFKNHPPFAASAVETAAKIFDQNVDAQWTADLGSNVLPDLATQRGGFADTLPAAAFFAAKKYKDTWKQNPVAAGQTVKANCAKEFAVQRQFAHVDRWLAKFPGHSVGKIIESRSNAAWCAEVFWQQHTSEFAAEFRQYTQANFKCADAAGGLSCPTLDGFGFCSGLLASVYQQKQCGLAASAFAQIAEEVQAYFIAKGSHIKCTIEAAAGAKPAVLRCTRPTQRYHCDKYYNEHYGPQSPTPLAVKALDCALSEDRSYFTKRENLWKQTVPTLQASHPQFKQFTQQPGIDPLLLGVSQQLYTEMQADAKKAGLEAKTVMTWEPGIDGLARPTLASNIGLKIKAATDTVPASVFAAPTRDGVNPPDPASGGLIVAPVVAAAALPARLTVLAPQTRIEAQCVNNAPQYVAVLNVRNSGDALAAGDVTLAVRENAGRGGGSLALPAIAKGETGLIRIPLNGIAMTPGARQLMFQFKQEGAGGPRLSLPAVQNARVTVPVNPCTPVRTPSTRARGG